MFCKTVLRLNFCFTPRGIIPRRVSFFALKIRISRRKRNQIPMVAQGGPGWLKWWKKTGGRKSRWTVPLKEQCHKAFTPIFFSLSKPICLLHIMHAGLCALKKHISYRPTVRIMYIKISWCKHICTNILYSLQGTHTVPWLYQVYTYEHVMVAYNTCTLYSVHIWYIYC